MKTCGLIACLLTFSTGAYAQTEPIALYGEAGLGVTIIPDTRGNTTGVIDGTPFSVKGVANYNPALAVSAEVGYAGFGNGKFRLGVSYDYMNITLRTQTLTGTIGGVPVNQSFTPSELNSLGLRVDNNTSVFAGQAYVNLPLINDNIRPYVGIGGGAAILEHAAHLAPAGSATAGLRYAFGPNGYLGVRYRTFYIGGTTDKLGTQHDAFWTHTFSVIIGGYLN